MQKSKTRRQATLALIAFGLGASSWLVSRPPGAAESLLSHVDMARSSASTSPARTLHTRTASRVDRQLESRTDLSEGRVSALEAAYATNQVIVAPVDGITLEALARDLGVEALKPAGASGYGAISVPAGMPLGHFLAELRSSGLVKAAAPNGLLRSAGNVISSTEASQVVADASEAVSAATAAITPLQEAVAATAQALAQAQTALATAEADLAAAKDAHASDAVEDALDAIVDTREDELDAAEDAHDDAVDLLEDAQDALSDLQEELEEAQEVLQSALAAEGAASLAAKNARLDKIRSVQWFLKRSGHPKWKLTKREDQEAFADADLSEWVVAVLDSGVAYENHADDAGTYVAAPSLSASAIVAPWDFINNDAHANDDHQHGTHIASIIASTGDLQGLAPSVSLMPIKVLDANNQGTELDLIAGIWHAIDNGAHVINMSLSFDSSYIPSLALRDAIAAAADAGIVMVAAAGNNGDGVVTWPAASPHVVAISSATLKDKGGHLRSAEYSNMSNGVALAAAGGLVDGDENEDGFSDGILAETIALNDPTRTGWWFYAGTSQAAALVSAAAVHLLDAGATGPEAANALQFAADDGVMEGDAHLDGFGSGALDLESALEALEDDRDKLQPRGTYHVAMLPYLKWKRVEEYDDKGKWKCKEQTKWKVKEGDKIEPTVLFTVFDDAGAPVKDVEVMGLMWGTKEGSFKCTTKEDGTCSVKGQSINPSDYQHAEDEMEVAQAWQVEALVHDNIGQVPSNMIFATDGFEVLVAAARGNTALQDRLLAFHAGQSCAREEIGEVAEGYTVVNAGTGLASSPLGLVFTSPLLQNNTTVNTVSVDLDGTGLASSPLGFTQFRTVDFGIDGTGLASSPLGLTQLRFLAFEGTGLASSPLGFHMMNVLSHVNGTGLASSPLGFDSNPVLLNSGLGVGVSLTGSSLGDQMSEDGWSTPGGLHGASILAESGLVGIEPTDGVFGSGESGGAGAEEIDPMDIQPED